MDYKKNRQNAVCHKLFGHSSVAMLVKHCYCISFCTSKQLHGFSNGCRELSLLDQFIYVGHVFSADDNATIRVTNLSEDTREEDLQDLFRPFGGISRIYLAKDKNTGASKVRSLTTRISGYSQLFFIIAHLLCLIMIRSQVAKTMA